MCNFGDAGLDALAATAEVCPAQMLPRIAALVLPTPRPAGAPETAETAAAVRDAARGAARRLKGAQALCQAVLRLGATLPPHAACASHLSAPSFSARLPSLPTPQLAQMLTTSALHGVNAAFNYAVTTSTTLARREMTFGHKSVVAVPSSAP